MWGLGWASPAVSFWRKPLMAHVGHQVVTGRDPLREGAGTLLTSAPYGVLRPANRPPPPDALHEPPGFPVCPKPSPNHRQDAEVALIRRGRSAETLWYQR